MMLLFGWHYQQAQAHVHGAEWDLVTVLML